MTIGVHPHIECLFNLCNRTADRHNHAIGWGIGHGKTIGPDEIDHRLIILRRGGKLFGELFDAEKLMIIGTGRIIETAQ